MQELVRGRLEPIGWPARVVVPLVGAHSIVCVVLAFLLLREVARLRRAGVIVLDADGSNFFFLASLAILAWASVVAGGFTLIWLYRAWSNVGARGLGGGGLLSRPRRAWWWFVPGLNALVPLHVLGVTWRGSVDADDAPGSVEWTRRRMPLRLAACALGQPLVLVGIVLASRGQPSFAEAWACREVLGNVECTLTEAGRTAWTRIDATLAGTLVLQAVLGGLLVSLIAPLNAMQAQLVAAYTSRSRDDLWGALRKEG